MIPLMLSVSMFLFSFPAILCVQRLIGKASTESALFVVIVTACLASWVTGMVFGSIPVVYAWIRYVVNIMLAVRGSCFYSVHLLHVVFTPGMTLQRCCVLSSGRTATQTCWSTFSVLSQSVSSSPSS